MIGTVSWIGLLLLCSARAHHEPGHIGDHSGEPIRTPTTQQSSPGTIRNSGTGSSQEHLQHLEERQYNTGGFAPSAAGPSDYSTAPVQPQYGSQPSNDYSPQVQQAYPASPVSQQYGAPQIQQADYSAPPPMAPQYSATYSQPQVGDYSAPPASAPVGYGAPVPQAAAGYGQAAYPFSPDYGYVDMEGVYGYAEESKWSKFNSMVQKNIKDSIDKQKEKFMALKDGIKAVADMPKEMATNLKNQLKEMKNNKKPASEPEEDYAPPAYGPSYSAPPAYGAPPAAYDPAPAYDAPSSYGAPPAPSYDSAPAYAPPQPSYGPPPAAPAMGYSADVPSFPVPSAPMPVPYPVNPPTYSSGYSPSASVVLPSASAYYNDPAPSAGAYGK